MEVNKFMVKLLQHLLDEEEIKSQEKITREELEKLKKHKRYLDKEKVKILNNYIFPSMANVVFFFKSIVSYPELREVFEDDIKDLLGVRRLNPQSNNYGFVFFNLLHSILLVGEGIYIDKREHRKDFRLRLNQLLQELVWAKFEVSLAKVFRNERAQRVVAGDFYRVWGWTRMLAEGLDEANEAIQTPGRIIDFDTYHLKEDWDNPKLDPSTKYID
jgi:hypothetical protein